MCANCDHIFVIFLLILRLFLVQRSFSFTKENQMPTKFGCVGTPQSSYARKSRILRPHIPLNWVDVVGEESLQDLKESEVKRQEVSFYSYPNLLFL